MGLGSSSSKNLKGQHVSLVPKVSKSSKNAKAPEYILYPLNGMLIDSKNGINYLSLDENESKDEVVAVASSEYDTVPYDDGTGTMATAAIAADAAAVAAENVPEQELGAESEMEPEPVSDKTTITEEEPKQKGGKRRKSAKSHQKNKQRKSRKGTKRFL